jgi:Tol biopolymer transport system component
VIIALVTAWNARPGLAQSGNIILASTSDSDEKGNFDSYTPAVSADASRVAFSSDATNLDPGDIDMNVADVYVKDLTTGDIVLVSTSDSGVKGDGDSFDPALSADGTTVAFWSSATNLDPADKDRDADVYVKDLTTGDILLASTSDSGVKGNHDSYFPDLSADGTRVAFQSAADNLDPRDRDTLAHIYVKDLLTGNIMLASASDAGVRSGWPSADPAISGNGDRVAFHTRSKNLDPLDTDLREDVYVKDLSTGDVILASTSDTGRKGNEDSSRFDPPSLSTDGTRVAFSSLATNLDPSDPDIIEDVYVKDLTTGDISLASTSDDGRKGADDSFDPDLSGDGARVAFWSTARNLDPLDPDGFADVYVKDLATGDLALASTSDEGLKGNDWSWEPSLSKDGARVAFHSLAENLDPDDSDEFSDIYVKRLGFPG